jgi:hypothetical protein
LISNNNAQLFYTINKNSITYPSILNIGYNGTSQNTVGTLLSSFLYNSNGDAIDFAQLSQNIINFDIGGLPIHKKLIVRARLFTRCTT